MALKILDISKYQPNVDYAKVAKVVDGVILRIGITYWGKQEMGIDSCFEKHYAGFKAVGCPVGVYYYSAADSVAMARKEAEYCLSLMKGKQFELPIYYDVENNERQGNLSKQLLTEIVDTFCSKVEKQGYFVGYYSYTAWLTSKFDTNYLNNKYTLWKADYRANYDKIIPCDMHQYTSGGVINGINGRVDLNNCFVDFEKIIKEKGLNGFNSTPPTSDLSKEPARLKIGFASAGDIKKLVTKINGLGIATEVKDGYIITGLMSSGDQCYIMVDCNALGIPYKIYEESKPQPPVEDCEKCKELEKQILTLQQEKTTLENLTNTLNEKIEILEKMNTILNKKIEDIKAIVI